MTTDLENTEQTTIEPSQATMTGQQWLDYLASVGELTDNWLVRLKEAERAFTGHSNVAGVMRGHGSKDTAAIAASSTSSLNQIRSMVRQIDKSMDALRQTYDRYDDYLNAHSTSNIRNRTVAENQAAHNAQRASMTDEERLATAGEAATQSLNIAINSEDGIVTKSTDEMTADINATVELEFEQDAQDMYRDMDAYLENGGAPDAGTGTRISEAEAFPDNDEMQRDFGPAASLEGIDSELVSANPNMSLDADGELRQNTVVVTPSGSYVRTLDMDAGV